jgi:GNAT superfamily N-acetyltransferase
MSREPAFRLAEPADGGALVAMLRRSLGPAMSEELWRWKHLESPFGPSPVLLAEAGGRIVGVRAFMRWRFRSGECEVEAVRAVDTATDPEWRRRGLFSELTRRLAESVREQGAAFVFNTPNRVSRRGYLRLGWSRVARVPVRVRGRPLAALARRLAPGTAPAAPGACFPPVAELLVRPELPGLLAAAESHAEARYRTPRTVPYLAWRYGAAPALDYSACWSFRAGRGAALVFRRRARGGIDQLLVSEVLASDREAARTLGADLLRRLAAEAGADSLAAIAPRGSLAGDALRAARFLTVPALGPLVTARRLAWTGETPDPLRWRSWCCSLGDLEVF